MEDLLHEFFNSKSDANKYLLVSQQEDLEKDFKKWINEESKDFEFVVRPLIKWMAENQHLHTKIILDATNAELVEGVKSVVTDEYLVD